MNDFGDELMRGSTYLSERGSTRDVGMGEKISHCHAKTRNVGTIRKSRRLFGCRNSIAPRVIFRN